MNGKKFFLNACVGAFSEVRQPGTTHHSFEEITGRLLHITFKETSKGEAMRLYIVDELNFYIISMFVKSRTANVFCLMARNLDLHSKLTLKMNRKDDKDFLSIYQFGSSVRWAYDQSNRHELPTDKDEKRAFLRSIIENETIPALGKILNPYPYHSIYKPLGSGNGLKGDYFSNDRTTARHNPVSESEYTAAGFASRKSYIKNG